MAATVAETSYASLVLYFFVLLVESCWIVKNANVLIYLRKHKFQPTLVDKSESGQFSYPITLHWYQQFLLTIFYYFLLNIFAKILSMIYWLFACVFKAGNCIASIAYLCLKYLRINLIHRIFYSIVIINITQW